MSATATAEIVYQDAAPVAPKPHTSSQFGRIFLMILLVVVCAIAGSLVFVSDSGSSQTAVMPTPTPKVSLPVSQPSTSENPSRDYKQVVIKADGAIYAVDKADKEIAIRLNAGFRKYPRFAPNGKFIAVLLASSELFTDSNLAIFNTGDATWSTVTPFDLTTTGVDNFFWLDDNNILLSQGGWLYRYNLPNKELLKLQQLNARLVDVSIAQKQLMFVTTEPRTVKERVTKQVVDPKTANTQAPKMIEVEVSPAIVKNDQVYLLSDLTGKVARRVKVEDFSKVPGSYILGKLTFTGVAESYLGQLFAFDPNTGGTNHENTLISWLNPTELLPISGIAPGDILAGSYDSAFSFILSKGESWQAKLLNEDRLQFDQTITLPELGTMQISQVEVQKLGRLVVLKVAGQAEVRGAIGNQTYWYRSLGDKQFINRPNLFDQPYYSELNLLD